MAQSGVVPERLTGTKEEQARTLEEINRLYDNPPGIMSEYSVNDFGSTLEINFDNNAVRGESVLMRLPSGRHASEAEKAGAVKYAVYSHRPALELAASSRRQGFATLEMSQKWGGRLLTNTEKKQANREIEQNIQKLFKSPMSKKGKDLNESMWKKEEGGWRRRL